ncbi:MAG: DUF4112 domain-containing protein [Fibrobacteria bacterium]
MTKPAVEVGRWEENRRGNRSDPRTALQHLESLAWLLDSSIPVPGTRFRIGLDSLIGLVPVIGDLLGAALSTYILAMSAKLGVPRVTLLRMGFNTTLDALFGMIPFAGDLFDAGWKANRRNVALLRGHLENPAAARRGDLLFASLFVILMLAVLAGLGWTGYSLGRWLLSGLGG